MSSLLWWAVAAIYIGLGLTASGGLRLVYFVLAAAVITLEFYKRRRRRAAMPEDSTPDVSS